MAIEKSLTIGMLAKSAEVNVETVRFYERKGLLKKPKKRGAFRYYPQNYIARIRFIKRSQELGFTLKEARELLDLRVKDEAKCSDVLIRTEDKVAEIEQKIADLKKMKKSLKNLAKCCEDRSLPLSDCPILECFIKQKVKGR